MPFNMGLFNRRLSLFTLLIYSGLTVNIAVANQRTESYQVVAKLNESVLQSALSLDAAKKSAIEALRLSRQGAIDTLEVSALLQLGSILSSQGDKTEAQTLFQQALNLSQKSQYALGECRALLEMGYLHYGWGRYDFSYTFFKQALDLAVLNQLKEEEAKALNLLGKYYHTRGDFQQSVVYYKKAIDVGSQLADYNQSVTFYLNIGKTYISEGNIYMTLSYYLKAFELIEKTENKLLKADVYNHLGSIYLLLKQPAKSLEFHRKALQLRRAINDPQASATSYNNLGETFLYMNAYDSAATNFNRSYTLCLQTQYRKGIIKALTNLGRVHNATGDLTEASQYLNEALQQATRVGYDAGIVESSLVLGQNLQLTKRYREALETYAACQSKMDQSNLNEFQKELFEGAYACYKALGNWPQALAYHEKLAQAESKSLQAESDRQLAELRITFDLERKENENQQLKQENEIKQLALSQRAWMLWSIAFVLLFTIILCMLIYNRYVQKRELNNQLQQVNSELERANTEKDKILSIIGHELRNPLYWFQNLTEMLSKNHTHMSPQKLEKSLVSIDESAKNAFHLMDNLLNWSRSQLNRIHPKRSNYPVEPLIHDTLQMFQTIVLQKEILLSIEIPDNIQILVDPDLFGCVLRNLISNAIKYTPAKGTITITATLSPPYCEIKVCDSGIGVTEQQLPNLFYNNSFVSEPGLMQEKGSGLGLKLCREFTQMNGGTIWVESIENRGTCFHFTSLLANANPT